VTAALRRRYSGFGQATVAGLAVAAGIPVFTWSAVTPVILITVVQVGLALAVRGRSR